MKRKADLILESAKFFKQEVEPVLVQYEKERKEDILPYMLLKLIWISAISTFICAFLQIPLLLVISLIFAGISFLARYLYKKFSKRHRRIEIDYEMTIKRQLMPKFLELFDCNLKWYKYKDFTLIDNNHVITYKKNDDIKTTAQLNNFYEQCYNITNTLNIFPRIYLHTIDDIIVGHNLSVPVDIIETACSFDFKNFFNLKRNNVASSTMQGNSKIAPVLIILPVCTFILPIPIFVILIIAALINKPWIMLILILLLFSSPLWLFIAGTTYINNALKNSKNLIIQFKIPKPIKGHTLIFEKGYKLNDKNENFERVILEDPNFENKYDTYSTDQIGARYMLTTAFIARFEDIKTAFTAKKIRAEFKDDKLSILIEVEKDMFQMGKITNETTFKTFTTMLDEIYSVLSLSEQLNLESKTGL